MNQYISDTEQEKHTQKSLISTLGELGKRIRRQRQEKNMTLDQLAAATNISKPYLSNIETARLVGPPSRDKMASIEKALAIEPGELVRHADWLRTPESIRQLMPDTVTSAVPRHDSGTVDLDRLLRGGETTAVAKRANISQQSHSTDQQQYRPLIQIPLINRVAAGAPTEYTDLDYPAGVADAYIPAPLPDGPSDQTMQAGHAEAGMFALRVEGDSMSPQYLPGDIIVFSSTDTPTDGDDCLIRLDEQGNFATTFKRIYFVNAMGNSTSDATHVQLCPLNPDHAKRIVARENITSLYPAVWKITPTPRRTPADRTAAFIGRTLSADAPAGKHRKRGKRATVAGSRQVQSATPDAAVETSSLRSTSMHQSVTQGFQIESD